VQGIGFRAAGGHLREAWRAGGLPQRDDFRGSGRWNWRWGGGLYAVGGYADGRGVVGLICWVVAQRTNLTARIMGLSITGAIVRPSQPEDTGCWLSENPSSRTRFEFAGGGELNWL